MTTTRTLADIDRDLGETVAAWQEAEKVARRNRTAARHALDAGSKDGYLAATNRAADAEAVIAECEALRDRLLVERYALAATPAGKAETAAKLAATPVDDDPFAGLS